MKITKQTLNRALRTFIQTVIGYAAINIVTIDFSASKQVLKSALIGLGVASVSGRHFCSNELGKEVQA